MESKQAAPDGYDRRKVPAMLAYRPMTIGEARRLTYGDHPKFLANDGTLRDCKVNGKPQCLKRTPRVRVPIKYGLYECATLEATGPDGDPFERLVVILDSESEPESEGV